MKGLQHFTFGVAVVCALLAVWAPAKNLECALTALILLVTSLILAYMVDGGGPYDYDY